MYPMGQLVTANDIIDIGWDIILNGLDTTELTLVYLNNVQGRNFAEMTRSWVIVGKNLPIAF